MCQSIHSTFCLLPSGTTTGKSCRGGLFLRRGPAEALPAASEAVVEVAVVVVEPRGGHERRLGSVPQTRGGAVRPQDGPGIRLRLHGTPGRRVRIQVLICTSNLVHAPFVTEVDTR